MVGNDSSLQARVGELQSIIKKRDEEIVNLKTLKNKATDKEKLNNKNLQEANRKYEEEKKKVTEYLKAKMEAQDSLRNAR